MGASATDQRPRSSGRLVRSPPSSMSTSAVAISTAAWTTATCGANARAVEDCAAGEGATESSGYAKIRVPNDWWVDAGARLLLVVACGPVLMVADMSK
jgi:hypothetical protein